MAKTYEALIRAEEEAQKKQVDPPLPGGSTQTPDDGISPIDPGPSTTDIELLFPGDRGEPSAKSEPFSEEYDRLRVNILWASRDEKNRTLLFTSPGGGEGASTVLVHFGTALANQGEKVVLIDADFHSPAIHKQFHLDRDPGLTDLLLGDTKMSNVIKRTGIGTLWVVTAGIDHPDPLSLLRSGSFDTHLGKLRSLFGWILFDGPPVNPFDEGLALSPKVDGVVMVLQAEKTRWEAAQTAKQRLEKSGAKILGVVLNKGRFYLPKRIHRVL